MVIGSCTVGRKTAGDGRVEVSADVVSAIADASGWARDVTPTRATDVGIVHVTIVDRAGERRVAAAVELMPCGCAKGVAATSSPHPTPADSPASIAPAAHLHRFLRADAFRDLAAGEGFRIELQDGELLLSAAPAAPGPSAPGSPSAARDGSNDGSTGGSTAGSPGGFHRGALD